MLGRGIGLQGTLVIAVLAIVFLFLYVPIRYVFPDTLFFGTKILTCSVVTVRPVTFLLLVVGVLRRCGLMPPNLAQCGDLGHFLPRQR